MDGERLAGGLKQEVERLRGAVEKIAWMGSDCPAAGTPEGFYRGQLWQCISIAANALKPAGKAAASAAGGAKR